MKVIAENSFTLGFKLRSSSEKFNYNIGTCKQNDDLHVVVVSDGNHLYLIRFSFHPSIRLLPHDTEII